MSYNRHRIQQPDPKHKNLMTVFPCAKINLGLYITERRADGYHNLQTVFYPIPLCDELQVEESETDRLELVGIQVAGDTADNLVMRALNLLREQGHTIPPLRIRLTKHIPTGAGLGGGSSDAAFMLRLLNEQFALNIETSELERLAARLGADCPFFIRCHPVLAEGIGDEFTPVALDLSGWFLVLIKPDDFISTKEAYACVKPRMPQIRLQEEIARNPTCWKETLSNDFEASVFPAHPTVAEIKENFYRQGAVYAAMSGSGSSVFALFKHPVEIATPYFHFACRL